LEEAQNRFEASLSFAIPDSITTKVASASGGILEGDGTDDRLAEKRRTIQPRNSRMMRKIIEKNRILPV
jgi:hypothetical protein